MALASFALVSRRWKPSTISAADYSAYLHLTDYLPKEIFDARIATLRQLIHQEYPHVWPDSYMFVMALAFVVIAAAFSIIARSQNVPIWYPLLILIAPALIAYWTTRRRGMYTLRLNSFEDALQTKLKQMTMEDMSRQVKWVCRRQRLDHTAEDLHLPPPIEDWSIFRVIQVVQIDPEVALLEDSSDMLPTYYSVEQDIVLDVGPPMQQHPTVTDTAGRTITVFDTPSGAQTVNFAPMAYPPPAYARNANSNTTSECTLPPAYDEGLR